MNIYGKEKFEDQTSIPYCDFEKIRPEEVDQITQKLNPESSSKRIENLHLYGKRGSGKPLVLSSVKSKLAKNRPDLYMDSIDCRTHDTEYKVLREMVGRLGKELPESGYSSSEARNLFIKALSESEKQVIILENVDLLLERDGDNLFYFLSRLDSEGSLPGLGVVTSSSLVANLNDMLSPRVRSSYDYEKIALESLEEGKVIRVLETYFGKYGVDKEIVAAVVNFLNRSSDGEDIDLKIAYEVLDSLVERYERPFDQETMKSAYLFVQRKRYNFLKALLSEHETLLLKAIRRVVSGNEKIRSGATYEEYRKLCRENDLKPHSDRILGDYLTRLSLLGFVDVERFEGGKEGKTRMIEPRPIIAQYDSNVSSNIET